MLTISFAVYVLNIQEMNFTGQNILVRHNVVLSEALQCNGYTVFAVLSAEVAEGT